MVAFICKKEYCLDRDTTDYESELEKSLIIRTREQKVLRGKKRALSPQMNFNDLAEECLKEAIGNQANFNYEGTNNGDMDAPSQDLFENSSSDSKKIKNFLEITKNQEIYDDFGLISNREMDAPLQTLFEDSTSKTAALESSENLTSGQMDENFEEASVVIPVTSYLDMVSKLENLRAIQVNQNSTVENIKAILARERVENFKTLTEMQDMKQDIKILLAVFESANEITNLHL